MYVWWIFSVTDIVELLSGEENGEYTYWNDGREENHEKSMETYFYRYVGHGVLLEPCRLRRF